MRLREKESTQKRIVSASGIIFFLGFLYARARPQVRGNVWFKSPVGMVLAAKRPVFLGYILVFLVFLENPFASRSWEVEPGQR